MPDKRLIDANALMKSFDIAKMVEYDETGCGVTKIAIPVQTIKDAPTIDAVEVVRKPVKGYEGYYEVDQFGRVYGCERHIPVDDNGRLYVKPVFGKQMKQALHTKGYKIVSLTRDGRTKTAFVHRLVAEAFLPNPDALPYVNHKDEDKTNNFMDNLEWCTQKYNLNYGKCKESWLKSFVPNFGRKIDVYTKYGVFVKSYNSVVEAEMDGYNKNSIFKCLFGRLDSHHGLVFKKHGEPFSYKNRSLNVFVKRVSEMDGSEKIYNTIVDAAKDNGLTKDKLGAFYRGTQKNVPIDGYKYEFFTA